MPPTVRRSRCDRHLRRGMYGEVVSPDGLLLTNHHCGYGAIQSLSSVEHDFLKNGFWARSRAEELPAPDSKCVSSAVSPT